jgi:hypothetical protein
MGIGNSLVILVVWVVFGFFGAFVVCRIAKGLFEKASYAAKVVIGGGAAFFALNCVMFLVQEGAFARTSFGYLIPGWFVGNVFVIRWIIAVAKRQERDFGFTTRM